MAMLKGRPDFKQSEETISLIKALRGVNQEITYDSLSGMVGFPVSGATPALGSARRNLERNESIVFTTLRGQGLRRLDDTGKVDSTDRHARTIGRTARRGRKRLSVVDNFAGLTKEKQLKSTLRMTQFEFAQQAVSSKVPAALPAVPKLDIKALAKAAKG